MVSPTDVRPNLYAGATLDRAGLRRRDASWLAACPHDPQTRVLPMWRTETLVDDRDPAAPRLAWRAGEALFALAQRPGTELALLGLEDGAARYVLDLSGLEAPLEHPALAGPGHFVELRAVGALLPAGEAAIAAFGRGLMWWHRRHRFCGVCGAPTASGDAGHVRKCQELGCGVSHFPRTDPAVIVLVHDGDQCLLGRQPRFPPGMYSTLAGFVEPGESLEEAAVREVLEEAGVHIDRLRYHSSQPWPFPASLMIGFHARATSRAITVHPDELEDARWFPRGEVRAAIAGATDLRLPRSDSISRRLIEDWVSGTSGTSGP